MQDLKGKPDQMEQVIRIESAAQSNQPYLYSRLNGLHNMGFTKEEMTKLDELHNTSALVKDNKDVDDTNRILAKTLAISIIRNRNYAEEVEFEEVTDEEE